MTVEYKNAKNMEEAIKLLLDELCIDWGFCLPQKVQDKIGKLKQVNADEFACLVLEAEEMSVELNEGHRRKIRNKFRDCFGNELVENDFNNTS